MTCGFGAGRLSIDGLLGDLDLLRGDQDDGAIAPDSDTHAQSLVLDLSVERRALDGCGDPVDVLKVVERLYWSILMSLTGVYRACVTIGAI